MGPTRAARAATERPAGVEANVRSRRRRLWAGLAVGVLMVVALGALGQSPAQGADPTPTEPAAITPSAGTPEPEPPAEPDDPAESSPAPSTPIEEPSPPTPTPAPTEPEPDEAEPTLPRDGVLEPHPPAWQTVRDPASWMIALVVLASTAVLVLLLARRPDPPERPLIAPAPVPGADPLAGTTAGLADLEASGEAMIDAGYSVTGVRTALTDIARVNGQPSTEIVVLPTALFVSTRSSGAMRTGTVSAGHDALVLNQIDALDEVIRAARSLPSGPGAIRAAVAGVRTLPSPYSAVQRVLAHLVLSAGLAVMLDGSWIGVAVAAALGLVVGTVLLLTEKIQRQYRALVTVGLAFGVSVTVFTLTQIGLDPGVLAALIAPLVTLLPGGLLTTGVIELATGQMMAGAGRLAAGGMQLILLAAGLVAGASLVGVPRLELVEAQNPIGPLGPWIAVAVFGVGIVIHRCGRPGSIAWILLVLYVAYGAQVLGDILFGGVLSGMIGAFAMTPVAYVVSRQPNGPAAFASFLPGFWLLVPGSLGLVGVTSLLDGDSTGLSTLITTAATMVAIMLGILVGSALGGRLTGRGTVAVV